MLETVFTATGFDDIASKNEKKKIYEETKTQTWEKKHFQSGGFRVGFEVGGEKLQQKQFWSRSSPPAAAQLIYLDILIYF